MRFQSKERQRNGEKWDFLVLAAPKIEQVAFDSSFPFFALWNHMEMLAMQAITQLSSRNKLFHVG